MRRFPVAELVWLFLVVAATGTCYVPAENEPLQPLPDMQPGYSQHTTIRINDDGEFIIGQNGVTGGDGSAGNPYRIENWYIDATGHSDAIYIGNTTLYFVVQNCILENATGNGITLYCVKNGIIKDNIIRYNSGYGVHLWRPGSTNNVISSNTLMSNNEGIYIGAGVTTTTVTNNNISSHYTGICLYRTSANTVSGNNIFSNFMVGIRLESATTNTLIYNTLRDNSWHGLNLSSDSSGNLIHHNNFINNYGGRVQGFDGNGQNFWNSSSQRGNYWSDYTTRYPGAGNNGIWWNTPYTLDGGKGARDFYPLVNQVGGVTKSLAIVLDVRPRVMNSTETANVTVHVTDGTSAVRDASIGLSSSGGGTFVPQNGLTDGNGNFTSIFTAPSVTTQTVCRITAYATKTGYDSGSQSLNVTINPLSGQKYLDVVVFAKPSTVIAGKSTAMLTAHVTNRSSGLGVSGATVSGALSPRLGLLSAFNDCGDGNYTAIYTPPSIVSSTTLITVTVTAKKTGYVEGSNQTPITVKPGWFPLTVTVSASPSILNSGQISDITVRVTNGTVPIVDAEVNLSSSAGGTFNPQFGTTNLNGYFTSIFTAPRVSSVLVCRLEARALKPGYPEASGYVNVTVKPVITYSVYGHVYKNGTVEGIPAATLRLNPGGKYTTTDSTGYYSFTGLANGTYTITVSKSGYRLSSATVSIQGADVEKDFYLIEKGGAGGVTYSIRGHIRIAGTDTPIGGASILLSPAGKHTNSDSNGYYCFTGLENGTYTITVSKSGYQNCSVKVSVAGANVTKDIYLAPASVTPGFESVFAIIAAVILCLRRKRMKL